MFWMFVVFCFFKQKTAYEMRISDWSSDVCSSDLGGAAAAVFRQQQRELRTFTGGAAHDDIAAQHLGERAADRQAKTGAAVATAGGAVALFERLEQAR